MQNLGGIMAFSIIDASANIVSGVFALLKASPFDSKPFYATACRSL